MPIWSKNFAQKPLILLALIETSILFSSVFFAYTIAYGDVESGYTSMGMIVPKAGALSIVMLMSMIAMGLYQFHQRAYFHEVTVRLTASVACAAKELLRTPQYARKLSQALKRNSKLKVG